jgi:murein DD-endopeptidase MepM/ murein hydrolase activator NlpD
MKFSGWMFSSFFSGLFFLFSAVSHAGDLRVNLLPSVIQPGDAFLLRIDGQDLSSKPSALLNETPLKFSSCGENCFAAIGTVDISAEPGTYEILVSSDGEDRRQQLRVLPGQFKTIYITLPQQKVTPGPEEMERILKEADLLESIWKVYTEKLWEGRFILPLPNPLSTPFGAQRIMNKDTISIHRGVDLKGKEGEEIQASNRGRVVFADELFFGGNTVILDHGVGIFTIYMHLSRFKVIPGDLVSKGDVIGFVGSTGRSTGPHLHFGVKVAGINASPVSLTGLELQDL